MTVDMSDTIVAPVVAELISIGQQITGIAKFYDKPPDSTLLNNSVMFPCRHIKVESVTNGLICLYMDFDIVHTFLANPSLVSAIQKCYAAIPAWATVLSQNDNVRMNGVAQLQDLHDMDVMTVKHANQNNPALISKVLVRYEFRIPR